MDLDVTTKTSGFFEIHVTQQMIGDLITPQEKYKTLKLYCKCNILGNKHLPVK